MAENIDNNILQELQKVEQDNQKFESEMKNILHESDSVLNIAESELKAINDYEKFKEIKNRVWSSEISRDLFKNYDGHNISSIYQTSASSTSKQTETIGPSLQITIKNDSNKKNANINHNNNNKTTLFYNVSSFEGCSKEFTTNISQPKLTVVMNVGQERSVTDHSKVEEVTKNIDVNSNNLPKQTQKITLKRPAPEPNEPEITKKIKQDAIYEDISIFDDTQTQYTQVIFDADETADANDPKWSEINNLDSIEDHFDSVRKQWRSMALPNPHKNLTTRFVPEDVKQKLQTSANANSASTSNAALNTRCMPCVTYLDNKINGYTQKVNQLYVRLNYLPDSNRGRSQRNKILKEIDELQKFVIEIVKNREEIQQNFKFYEQDTWNANYLTRTELDELKEQEKLLEFQKKFYGK